MTRGAGIAVRRRRWLTILIVFPLVAAVAAVSVQAVPEQAEADISCPIVGIDAMGLPVVKCGGGGGNGGGGDEDEGDGGTYERPECVWVSFDPSGGLTWTNEMGTEQTLTEEGLYQLLEDHNVALPDSEDVQWWWLVCGEGTYCPPGVYGLDSFELCSAYDTRTSWAPATDPIPPGVSAEAWLLGEAWAQVRGQLVVPEPDMHPPEAEPAIVQIPTFMAVDNPPPEDGSITDCVLVPGDEEVCVTLNWTTSMWYDPGDGTDRVSCDLPGTRFDPDGGPLDSQAGSNSCTHIFDQDNAGYPAEVGFTYDFTWSSTTGGDPGFAGSFDPFELSYPFTRQVDEVQSVVTDADLD